MQTKEDINEIIQFYREDERLIRYIDKFHEEVSCPHNEKCPNEIMAVHLWEAYWIDIGGEGA